MEADKKTVRTLIIVIAFGVIATWGLFRPAAILGILHVGLSLLRPFIIGLSIAFVVNLLLQPVERGWDRLAGEKFPWLRKLKRPPSIFVSMAFIGIVFVILLVIVLPELIGTIMLVVDDLPKYSAYVETWRLQLESQLEAYGVASRIWQKL